MESPRRSRLANEINIFDEEDEHGLGTDDVDHVDPAPDKLGETAIVDTLHDRAPSPPEDPQESSHQESTDDEPSFDEDDPFTESDASDRDEGFADEEESFESKEYGELGTTKPLSYQVVHTYDRSFSTTTAIHLDDPDHPGHHESLDYKIPGSGPNRSTPFLYDATTLGVESRKQSDNFSILPEDVELPRTPSKHDDKGVYSPTPKYTSTPRDRLLSHPSHDYELNTPTRDRLLSSTRARDGSSQHRPVFRNPSSVRAMQMSSPPPFPSSPRSARQRRMGSAMSMSQNGGSVHRGFPEYPPKPSNPNKEYPLMLLHCSVTMSPLPYSPATLQAVLPQTTMESLFLLREKIGMTILERGLLIPHPGDEYELLEERVLETLELKTPRIGKCGHFVTEISANNDDVLAEMEIKREKGLPALGEQAECGVKFDGAGKCDDCKRHIAPELLGHQVERSRRWDIKVFAANGLMRAGAWATAWREMEKIDLEVGVFIPDDLRRQLDDKTETEGKGVVNYGGQSHELPDDLRRTVEAPMAPLMTRQRSSGTDMASTAAMTRPPSRHSGKGTKSRQASQQLPSSQVPLSTLLANYIRHNVQKKPEVFVGIIILLIGILFSGRSLFAPNAPVEITTQGTSVPMEQIEITSNDSVVASATTSQRPVIKTVTESLEATTAGWHIPACTFAAGELDAREMVALPRDIASSVLDSLASTKASSDLLATPSSDTKSSTVAEATALRAPETNSEVSVESASAALTQDAVTVQSEAGPGMFGKVLEVIGDTDDQEGLEE